MKKYKVVVTVPESDANSLRQAIGEVGAGKIGNYDFCSFSVKGIGRFLPIEGANPKIGQVGKLEEVLEERIEVNCDEEILESLIQTIRKVHPYEEPAIDIYELKQL